MPEENNYSRTAIERLGLNPDNLGCVMLGVELPTVYTQILESYWAYTSPKFEYVRGYEGDPHITLLYGLLFNTKENQDLIDGVLENWHKPNVVVFPEVLAFDANDGHEDYSAIVLGLGTNDWDLRSLKEANDELRKLPHVNGFPVYQPHVTVGYVRREFANSAVNRLKQIEVRPLRTTELMYT